MELEIDYPEQWEHAKKWPINDSTNTKVDIPLVVYSKEKQITLMLFQAGKRQF